jgi:flavin reductase
MMRANLLEPNPTVDREVFRDAMARLTAAVNLITTDGVQGRAGLTATAVCSVSDEPARVLVCVNRSASAHALILANRVFAINVLSSAQQTLAGAFASKLPMHERFDQAQWRVGKLGAPLLEASLVNVECELVDCVPVGSHDVMIGAVHQVTYGPMAPALAYFNRAYNTVG